MWHKTRSAMREGRWDIVFKATLLLPSVLDEQWAELADRVSQEWHFRITAAAWFIGTLIAALDLTSREQLGHLSLDNKASNNIA